MKAPAIVVAALVALGLPTAAAVAAAGCAGPSALQVHPGDDVVHVVDDAGSGRTICFAAGTYRLEEPIRPRTGQTLIGTDAVLLGSHRLTGSPDSSRRRKAGP